MTDCGSDKCEGAREFLGKGAKAQEAIAAAEAVLADDSAELGAETLETLVDEAKTLQIVRDAAAGNILSDDDDE